MNTELLKTLWSSFTDYQAWLDKQPVSAHTRRAYRSRINHFLVYLATSGGPYMDVLKSARVRDRAVRDYKEHLRDDLRASASTINTTLATLDHFFKYLGLGEPDVERAELRKEEPTVLTGSEQQLLLRAVKRSRSRKDRAIMLALMYTGMRVGECAALDLEDIDFSQPVAVLNIRSARENRRRQIGLNNETAFALSEWIEERNAKYGDSQDKALFVNRQGKRISTAGLDLIVRKTGRQADLELSTGVLRHTCLMSLFAGGSDVGDVARVGGHKRRETTKRYRPVSITIAEEPSDTAAADSHSQLAKLESFDEP